MLGIIIVIVIIVIIAEIISNSSNNIEPPKNENERLDNLNKKIQRSYYSLNEGEAEERYIESELQKQNFPKRVLRDMYIPYNNETKQIDVLLITEFGIYVIENKDYSGWIFGSENNKNWTQSLNKNSRYSFYNPIWQNRSHIKALSKFMYLEEKYFKSLIIFSGKAEFKKIPISSENYAIINDYEIDNYINHEKMNKKKIFTEEQMEKFYNMLLPSTQVSDEIRQQHIENVMKYK